MRVGLIIYGDLSLTSGGYLYDRRLVGYLRAQGDEVEIFSLPWRNYRNHLLDNLRRDLMNNLRQTNFDILLQDELNHPSLFWLNRRLRPHITWPLISVVHHLRSSERHPTWQLKLFHMVERSYLQTIDGFVFNSETTRGTVKALLGKEKTHVVAYPAGDHIAGHAEPAFILERAQRNGPLRLLFVGNVTPRKGLHLLLAALETLSEELWQLEVIGDLNTDRTYAERLMKPDGANGFSNNITWHGRLHAASVEKLMASSHVLVVPSSYEGFGIVYLEGMRYGLPAIGTTSGAAHEIISHGQNGFLIDPDDAGSLVRHIITLHQDRQLLAQMSAAALARSQSHPTWETSMRRIRDFLLQFAS
jgi:glycosyltransferase involved in cell wall biosynthesis